jgi:hypothetical protein
MVTVCVIITCAVLVAVAAAAARRKPASASTAAALPRRLYRGGFTGPHIVGYPRNLLPDEK